MNGFRIFLEDGMPIKAGNGSRAELINFEITGRFVPPHNVLISGWTKIRQHTGRLQTSDTQVGAGQVPSGLTHEDIVGLMMDSVVADYSKTFEPNEILARTTSQVVD